MPTATSTAADPDGLLVVTDHGVVQGVSGSNGDRHFFGIPYAASTAGENRFRPPRRVRPWHGTFAADQHRPACPQNPAVKVQPALPQSEDCLNLDVYAPPAAASHHLPVMVFIYGGAYLIGSAGTYDPTPLVDTGNVIVVQMNYRLGPLGFLALPELRRQGRPRGTMGNAGILDQRAALRWVKRNIAAFGGDPNNVTLFGESAGGNSVCTHLASPLSKGLFQRAIVQSGACTRGPLDALKRRQARRNSAAYAADLGCRGRATRLSCLRSLPAERLLSPPSTRFESLDAVWRPVIDKVTLRTSVGRALRRGAARRVEVLQGTNHDEGRFLVALIDDLAGHPVTAESYVAWLQHTYGSAAGEVVAHYPVDAFLTPSLAKAQVVTDGFFACPGVFTVADTVRGGGVTWQYEFDETVPVVTNIDPLMPLGMDAFHAAELFYLFSTVQQLPSTVPPTLVDQPLAIQLQRQWTTFARTGNPEADGLPAWHPSDGRGATLTISSASSSMADQVAQEHQCDFWSEMETR